MDPLDLGETIRGYAPGQKVFNRYSLKKILGRGGMGVVWLAHDAELDVDVALKFLPEVVALDREAVSDMKKETRRSLKLTHANIVRIYDFLQDARAAAISMEYVDGASLSSRKGDQPQGIYPLSMVRPIVEQLCGALDYAHNDPKIVHRDLKPANLMLDGRGRLKITDFGIARSISDSVSRVSAQAGSSGTPAYMSPQQMMGGEPAVADDIYSLGATLYELLTSKPPFYSGNLIAQVQGKIPAPMMQQRQTLGVSGEPIPVEWEEVIAACLAKEPQDRPQSAREVAGRLGLIPGYVAPAPAKPAAPPPLPVSVAQPPVAVAAAAETKKASSGLWIGIVATAVILLGAAGYYFGVYAPRVAAEQAEQERIRQNAIAAQQAADAKAAADKAAADKAAADQKARDEAASFQAMLSRITNLPERASVERRAEVDAAVQEYLQTAPLAYRGEVAAAWKTRQAAIADALTTGALSIASRPAGATFWLNGEAKGTTPLKLGDLPPGEYNVRLSLNGYVDDTLRVTVQKNRETQLDRALLLISGSVQLTSNPSGAEVWLARPVISDGNSEAWQAVRLLGKTPLTLNNVPEGDAGYEIRMKGYQAALAHVTVHAGDVAKKQVNLVASVRYPEAGSSAQGEFYYYQGSANRYRFTLSFGAASGGKISGRITEPRVDFGPENVSVLTSQFSGQWIPAASGRGAKVIFTKVYDFDGHAVVYSGDYNADTGTVTGEWDIDGFKGGFTISGVRLQ